MNEQKPIQPNEVRALSPSGEPVYLNKEELQAATLQGYSEATPEDFQQAIDRAQFGGVAGTAGAAALGAARGVSLGLSDVAIAGADAALGTDLVGKAEKLKEYNPVTSGVANVAGTVLGTLAKATPIGMVTTGAAKIASKAFGAGELSVAKQILQSAASEGLQGAAQGAGDAISETALRENEGHIGESFASNIGLGSVLGAGFGGTLKAGEKGVAKIAGKFKASKDLVEAVTKEAEDAAMAATPNIQPEVTPTGQAIDGINKKVGDQVAYGGTDNTSLKTQGFNELLEKSGIELDEPTKKLLEIKNLDDRAAARIELAVNNPNPSPQQTYVKKRLEDLNLEIDRNIETPFGKVTTKSEAQEADSLKQIFQDRDVAIKKELSPIFEQSKDVRTLLSNEQVLEALEEAYPGLSKLVKIDAGEPIIKGQILSKGSESVDGPLINGKILSVGDRPGTSPPISSSGVLSGEFLSVGAQTGKQPKYIFPKYDLSLGISKQEYKATKELFDKAVSDNMTYGELGNARRVLREARDTTRNGAKLDFASSFSNKLWNKGAANVEDQIGNGIKNASRAFAKNEEIVTRLDDIGINFREGRLVFKSDPERFLNDVSRNTNVTTQFLADAKTLGILPQVQEKLAALIKHRLNDLRDPVTKQFKQGATRKLIGDNQFLIDAITTPGTADKILANIDLKRSIDTKFNKSGTAIMQDEIDKLKGMNFGSPTEMVFGAIKNAKNAAIDAYEGNRIIKEAFDAAEQNRSAADALARSNKKISERVAEFFSENSAKYEKAIETTGRTLKAGVVVAGLQLTQHNYGSHKDKFTQVESAPEAFINDIVNNDKRLAKLPENIRSQILAKKVIAAQFLLSKFPKQPPQMVLDKRKYLPSNAEVGKFNRYVSAVENPYGVLDKMVQGTLGKEHVEALSTVYPEIYKEMKKSASLKMAEIKTPMTMQKKIMLSIFMGEPLTDAMTKLSTQNQQMNNAAPDASDQEVMQGGGFKRKPDFSGSVQGSQTNVNRLLNTR